MNQFITGLERITEFLSEMQQTSSNNEKLAIFKRWKSDELLVKLFRYAGNPYKKYGVHTRVLKKNSNLTAPENLYQDFFQLLDDLSDRNLTGHAAIQAVNSFINEIPTHLQPILYSVLDRDLRAGISMTTVLKVIPGLIPTFSVALAHAYNPKRTNFETETWLGSRKLDGIRTICRKEGNQVTFLSRSGKEFLTLGKLEELILKIPGNFILDGELCIVDDAGNENFQEIVSEIRRKNHTIENPKYLLFDFLTLDEFDSAGKTKSPVLTERLKNLATFLETNQVNSKFIEPVEQVPITSDEHFAELVKYATDHGHEGIMVRNNISYEGKRSHNLLKVKQFHDAEYKVIDLDSGLMRWTENGAQVEKICVRNLVIEHKGNRVGVGSGFSKEQREYYHANPNELIGKTVTIQYFEESQNQSGGYSLRFPVLKHIYDNGRDC